MLKQVTTATAILLMFGSLTMAQDKERVLIDKPVEFKIEVEREEEAANRPPKVSPYWIGIGIEPLSDTLKSQLGVEDGMVVTLVNEGSPAAKAGLKLHDIVLQFNKTKIRGLEDLLDAVGEAKDKESSLVVIRNASRKTLSITPVKRPDPVAVDEATADLRKALEEALKKTGNTDLKKAIEEALKSTGFGGHEELLKHRGAGQRYTILGAPALAAGVKLPKQLELHATVSPDGAKKYEIILNGKKYVVEGDDFSKLPAEVRQALPFFSSAKFAPRILMFADTDVKELGKFEQFTEKARKQFENFPTKVVPPAIPRRIKAIDELRKDEKTNDALKKLTEQMEALSKEMKELKKAVEKK